MGKTFVERVRPRSAHAAVLVAAVGVAGWSGLSRAAQSPGTPAVVGPFQPVPLPDPRIPGFKFPEAEPTIVGWTVKNDQASIHRHAWGIWTALHLSSGQRYLDQDLRVFETWETPADILAGPAAAAPRQTDPRPLERFRQHTHRGRRLAVTQGLETVLGFVKYDPSGAAHIRKNGLLSKSALGNLVKNGATAVPDFPDSSLSLKPVFQPISPGKLVQGRYFSLANWPGPPNPPKPFGPPWGPCVWVDVQDASARGSGQVDTVCKSDGSSRTAATTYGVGQFINFRLSAAQADALNAQAGAAAPVAAGNYAILLGMHVTSREITRWTWQTFWWAPNPDNPVAPSSRQIAALRPAQLTGAPRNYAGCAAYQMEAPPQPNTGGKNVGESVYCYNPWLESPFGPGDLPDSIPGKYQGKTVANNTGVETNCMSCHGAANFNPNGVPSAPDYSGDRYLDLNDPRFKGTLKVDFLWSLPQNAR